MTSSWFFHSSTIAMMHGPINIKPFKDLFLIFRHQEHTYYSLNCHYTSTRICNTMPLMKRQSVITHTIRHTDLDTLLGIWVTNAPSVKMLCQKKFSLYSHKNVRCVSVGLLRIGQVFIATCKTVCGGSRQTAVS